MRTLVRLHGAQRWGKVHTSLEATVHLCCHRLVPAVKARARRKGTFGEVAVELTAATLAACHRTPRK